MRIYCAVDAALLARLQAGESVTVTAFRAETEDEEDELAALDAAADVGDAVVAAEVDAPGDVLTLQDVASIHVDLDGSGHLAWFGTQEIEAVLQLLRER